MSRFVEGEDRRQPTLLPSCLDDYVGEDNPARVIDVFVDELDLGELGFVVTPAATGRPAYHPATLLKLYVYGYLNRAPSSRRLEREAQRNVELMWLTGKLAPDHKTIANFRKDHGPAIQAACAHFVVLCRQIGLFSQALAAVDGSKFKAVNTRDKNFTPTKLKKRMEQVAEHIAGYLQDLDAADRQAGEAAEARAGKLKAKIATLRAQMQALKAMETRVEASPDGQVSLTDPDARSMATNGRGSGIVGYNVQSVVDAEHHLIVARRRRHHRQRPPAARRHGRQGQGRDGRGEARAAGRPRLLLRRGDRRLRGPRRDALCAQAADLRRQGRRPLRQAGLCVHARPGRLSLPGRRSARPAHDHHRERAHAAPLLEPVQLRDLRPEGPVHASQGAARHPLGA
jgi:transposase